HVDVAPDAVRVLEDVLDQPVQLDEEVPGGQGIAGQVGQMPDRDFRGRSAQELAEPRPHALPLSVNYVLVERDAEVVGGAVGQAGPAAGSVPVRGQAQQALQDERVPDAVVINEYIDVDRRRQEGGNDLQVKRRVVHDDGRITVGLEEGQQVVAADEDATVA